MACFTNKDNDDEFAKKLAYMALQGHFSDDETTNSLTSSGDCYYEERELYQPTTLKFPSERVIQKEISFILNFMIRTIEREDTMERKKLEKMKKQEEKNALKKQKKEEQMKIQLEKKKNCEEKKLEKLFIKLKEQEERKRQKDSNKKEKQLIKQAEKNGMIKGRLLEREKQKKKMENSSKKFELKDKAIGNMVKVAKELMNEYRDEGFYVSQCVDKYIQLYGRINPYTLESVDDNYDLSAAIRGFMYETSPSSTQHWFRYGIKKVREQVAPWIFVNKELAIVNDKHGWITTTTDMASERRTNAGKWKMIVEGTIAYYDWDEEKYGPLPTSDILEKAAENRKVGIR